MEFIFVGNTALVFGTILIIEVIKKIIEEISKKETPDWIWKLIALVSGIPAAIIATKIAGIDLSIWKLIGEIIKYSGACTLVYQTGKMSFKAIQEKLPNKKKDKN